MDANVKYKVGDWVVVEKEVMSMDSGNHLGEIFQIKTITNRARTIHVTGYKYKGDKPGGIYVDELRFATQEEIETVTGVKALNKEELLAKARKDYPVGTVFRRVHTKDKDKPDIISTGKFEFEGTSWRWIRMTNDEGDFLNDAEGFSAVCYYSEYGWAEIVSKPETNIDSSEKHNFKLPEKWCLKLSSKEINVAVNSIELWSSGKLYWEDCSTYKNNYIGNDGEYYSKIPSNFTEITFEQFKKYVLKKEIKFEVGKWYKVGIKCKYDYFKYSNTEKVNSTNSYERIYFSEYISYEKYTPVKDYIANFEIQNSCVEAALSEIQHYLPNGHPDKIKVEWWKTLKKGDVVRCIANSRNIDTRKVGKEYTLTADCDVSNFHVISYAKNARSKYYAEFELVRRFGELPKVEKWSVGTYCVVTCDKKSISHIKLGDIIKIKEYNSAFNNTQDREISFTDPKNTYSDKCKWFATKEEAEEFAKTLTVSKYPEYVKVTGDGNNNTGHKDCTSILEYGKSIGVILKVLRFDNSMGKGYESYVCENGYVIYIKGCTPATKEEYDAQNCRTDIPSYSIGYIDTMCEKDCLSVNTTKKKSYIPIYTETTTVKNVDELILIKKVNKVKTIKI